MVLKSEYPAGWDEARVREVLDHYEGQTEDEAVAEDCRRGSEDLTMAGDKASGMKSAYEAALERLERQGIERPREDSLSEAARAEIAEIRRKAEARLAELEILHKDPKRQRGPEDDEDYVRERRRIEEDRDRKIRQVRGD